MKQVIKKFQITGFASYTISVYSRFHKKLKLPENMTIGL